MLSSGKVRTDMSAKEPASQLKAMASWANDHSMTMGLSALAIIVVFALMALWVRMFRRKRNEKTMNKVLDAFPVRIANVSDDLVQKYALRDFYIASSLNSCCSASGDMYTYVGIEPLQRVISQGARALDFEVFTVQGQPVVSTSVGDSDSMKATLNAVPFGDAMKTAARYGFSGAGAQNAGDPLIINIRMSTARDVYGSMAKSIQAAFGSRLLHTDHPDEGSGENIGRTPMKDLMGKVIILCTGGEQMYKDNKAFSGLVNGSANGMFIRNLSHYDVLYGAGNDPELLDYNKKNMSVVVPVVGEDTTILVTTPLTYGCQMVFMDYSEPDSNLALMLTMFNEAGSAFVLKPKSQRYIPVTIKKPPPQNPDLSYAPKTLSKPYFTANI
jgi:hypothetical protein